LIFTLRNKRGQFQQLLRTSCREQFLNERLAMQVRQTIYKVDKSFLNMRRITLPIERLPCRKRRTHQGTMIQHAPHIIMNPPRQQVNKLGIRPAV